LLKLLSYILFEKYIYILALEMASSRNQHRANFIGTLSFPKANDGISRSRNRRIESKNNSAIALHPHL